MAKGKECNGIVLLLIFVLLSVSWIKSAEAVNVPIRDVNLEIVVRSALIKPAGNLTDQDWVTERRVYIQAKPELLIGMA